MLTSWRKPWCQTITVHPWVHNLSFTRRKLLCTRKGLLTKSQSRNHTRRRERLVVSWALCLVYQKWKGRKVSFSWIIHYGSCVSCLSWPCGNFHSTTPHKPENMAPPRDSLRYRYFLPPANEFSGKVMFFQLCVILFRGGGRSLSMGEGSQGSHSD